MGLVFISDWAEEYLEMIKAVIFDFGGVLAEEGFKEALMIIGKEKGLHPDMFFKISSELVYQTGYITGRSSEHSYWNAVREKTGIRGDDKSFREVVLKAFRLRPEMICYVDGIKSAGLTVAILSDQTNWLDELDQRTPFYHHFDHIFNSFYLGKTKRDASLFSDICDRLDLNPEEVFFIDDHLDNVKRASSQGLRTFHFKNVKEFEKEFQEFTRTAS
jgi:putative hydrolase of the HAD superfamily